MKTDPETITMTACDLMFYMSNGLSKPPFGNMKRVTFYSAIAPLEQAKAHIELSAPNGYVAVCMGRGQAGGWGKMWYCEDVHFLEAAQKRMMRCSWTIHIIREIS